jgi:hypothetical protein
MNSIKEITQGVGTSFRKGYNGGPAVGIAALIF